MGLWKTLIGDDDDDEEEEELKKLEQQNTDLTKKQEKLAERRDTNVRPAAQPEPARPVSAAPKKYTEQFKLAIIEPHGFEESPRLVDNLKARKPIIINLENLDTDTARHIFDFLSGATYALGGAVQKVSNGIFLFAPENVDVSMSSSKNDNASERSR